MRVKQLISELKKMPRNVEVGFAAHDNCEEEVAGWVCSLIYFEKSNYDISDVENKGMFNSIPDECVILRA